MSEFNPHYYRKSIRLKNYDYSQPGWYFVTIDVDYGKKLFGSVQDCKIVFNNLGMIVEY